VYYFHYSYAPEDEAEPVSVSVSTSYNVAKKAVKHATQSMVRTILLLAQTMSHLPSERYLSMKLLYHDHTPEDYEPACFRPAAREEVLGWDAKTVNIRLGGMKTAYHEMNLRVRAPVKAFLEGEEDMAGLGYQTEDVLNEIEEVRPVENIVPVQEKLLDVACEEPAAPPSAQRIEAPIPIPDAPALKRTPGDLVADNVLDAEEESDDKRRPKRPRLQPATPATPVPFVQAAAPTVIAAPIESEPIASLDPLDALLAMHSQVPSATAGTIENTKRKEIALLETLAKEKVTADFDQHFTAAVKLLFTPNAGLVQRVTPSDLARMLGKCTVAVAKEVLAKLEVEGAVVAEKKSKVAKTVLQNEQSRRLYEQVFGPVDSQPIVLKNGNVQTKRRILDEESQQDNGSTSRWNATVEIGIGQMLASQSQMASDLSEIKTAASTVRPEPHEGAIVSAPAAHEKQPKMSVVEQPIHQKDAPLYRAFDDDHPYGRKVA
jgi:hypothetical protein